MSKSEMERLAKLELAMTTVVRILAQPGSPLAAWMRTSTRANGEVGVPELYAALQPFAPRD